jgi:CubicO group peptidase (beta-lactamase class C family)
MHRRKFLLGSIGAGIAALGGAPTALAESDPKTIREALEQNTNEKVGGSIAVVVDDSDTRVVNVGTTAVPQLALDADTVFEIGSITKVFTALMLADMVVQGEVALDDPVAKYLPPSVTLHERGRPITLLDLATYTSGLPNLPGNFNREWFAKPNPFADYAVDSLYQFLSTYTPEYEPGTHYEYANLGFGLLGLALARRARKSYEELLVERVSVPLGLAHTRITLTDDMKKRVAQGHAFPSLQPVPLWDMPAIQGAGALRSTAKDMTVVLRACMRLRQTPLDGAFKTLLETRKPTGLAGTDVGLGWFISSNQNEEIVWKLGATGGQNAVIGFSTRRPRGALVLCNGPWHPMHVGMQLISPDFDPGDVDSLMR